MRWRVQANGSGRALAQIAGDGAASAVQIPDRKQSSTLPDPGTFGPTLPDEKQWLEDVFSIVGSGLVLWRRWR